MAAQLTVIAPQTAAVTTKAPFETNGYDRVFVSANLLAGAEEIDLFMDAGGTWVAVPDVAMTGTAKLTATITGLELAAGPRYAAIKDATAGACGVFVTLANAP
jgi:hypothetical protein